jgi:translation initiation factor IF-2
LQIVLKGDVQGSVEALVGALKEIPQTKITLDIIHSAVGPITESDVLLASASNAVIIGFSVKVENNASTVSKREAFRSALQHHLRVDRPDQGGDGQNARAWCAKR